MTRELRKFRRSRNIGSFRLKIVRTSFFCVNIFLFIIQAHKKVINLLIHLFNLAGPSRRNKNKNGDDNDELLQLLDSTLNENNRLQNIIYKLQKENENLKKMLNRARTTNDLLRVILSRFNFSVYRYYISITTLYIYVIIY